MNGFDVLELDYTLPKLAKICLHKSTAAKFYPFTESDKDLLEEKSKDMVEGPSIVFTRKFFVSEMLIRDSWNRWKTFVGIITSQLHPTLRVKRYLRNCTQDGS